MQYLSDILLQSSTAFADAIAIDEPGRIGLTYSELHEQCMRLKRSLATHNISVGERVGIFMPKNAESVIAILGTLASGAAYIPVDVQAPVSRGGYIFADCQVRAILVAGNLVKQLADAVECKYQLYDIAGFNIKLVLCSYPDEKPLQTPDHLAYMLYTSGSTGTPKGVMITHRNALCFIEWCARQFSIPDEAVFLSLAPFHFDLSIFDLYVSLFKGGCLVLIDQKRAKNPRLIAEYIAEKKVNVIYTTPTMLKLMLRYGKCEQCDHSSLNKVLFAGEVFPATPLRQIKRIWSQADFYNLYGPTETNVVTWYAIPTTVSEKQTDPFPIGRACPYAVCKIWDGIVVDPFPGLRGELIVSGESVATGYLNLSQKNAEAFLNIDSECWYKTGDIVEVNENYEYVFIGRKDRMIKRNGYRIELAEIEAALSRHPDITEACVISTINGNQEICIKAFIHKRKNGTGLNVVQLRSFCLDHLPGYMLPDQFVSVEHFPKTSTHKIDYQQLKQYDL